MLFTKTILHGDGLGVGDSISTFLIRCKELPLSKQYYQLGALKRKIIVSHL